VERRQYSRHLCPTDREINLHSAAGRERACIEIYRFGRTTMREEGKKITTTLAKFYSALYNNMRRWFHDIIILCLALAFLHVFFVMWWSSGDVIRYSGILRRKRAPGDPDDSILITRVF